MDYWFDAFLGKTTELRRWQQTLPSTVVFHLNGELGMVPVTYALAHEVTERGGKDPLLDWGKFASAESTLAYISISQREGIQSNEWGVVWSNGQELDPPNVTIPVIIFLKNQAEIDFVLNEVDLDCYRGENLAYVYHMRLGSRPDFKLENYGRDNAAEKWAAAAFIERPVGATGILYYIKLNQDGKHAAIYRIYQYIEKVKQYGLFGDYWDWSADSWVTGENVIRQYRNGFDADVDSASEVEVIRLIRALRS
jgi:hypothetical protein